MFTLITGSTSYLNLTKGNVLGSLDENEPDGEPDDEDEDAEDNEDEFDSKLQSVKVEQDD